LLDVPAKRHIVVAGEMLELGSSGEQLHQECGRYIANKKVDLLLGVRGLAAAMVKEASKLGAETRFVETPEDAGDWLAQESRDGDMVLLKASRGVKLERALERWKEKRNVSDILDTRK